MAKNKSILFVTGITTENNLVIGGCFDVYQIHGVPLDIIFNHLKAHNYVPDWIDIYKSARSNGMSHERILAKLEPEIIDSFGLDWSIKILEVLNKVFGEKK